MILTIFGFLFCISLLFVVIGLWKPEHSEMAIIGFFFLFLLSFPIMQGTLQYETGANTTSIYNYNTTGVLISSSKVTTLNYDFFQEHNIGYWMAILSSVGMIIMFVSLRKTRWSSE